MQGATRLQVVAHAQHHRGTPKLVQISTAYGPQAEGSAALPRNEMIAKQQDGRKGSLWPRCDESPKS